MEKPENLDIFLNFFRLAAVAIFFLFQEIINFFKFLEKPFGKTPKLKKKKKKKKNFLEHAFDI